MWSFNALKLTQRYTLVFVAYWVSLIAVIGMSWYGLLSARDSLRSLPVRSIKIDRSIIHNMLDDADDMAAVQGMIGLASAFKREVIAEGVETPRHRQALLRLGCHLIQGHGIAHPMPAARMQRWMRAHATRH